MTHFILVHGGCHEGDCWDLLAGELRKRGHHVETPTLPGHGHAVPRASLEDGIAAIARLVEGAPGPVVLVGHSLGGMTISAVAEAVPDRIAHLVYVSALLPVGGESAADLGRHADFRATEGSYLSDDGAWAMVRPELARELFYADCSAAVANAAMARLCPTDTSFIVTAVQLSADHFGRVPKHYVVCLQDAAIGLNAQRSMIAACPGVRVAEIDTGHSPFLARPRELADLIEVASN